MTNCTNCKHASWKKTASGRLHPNGNGICTVEIKLPPLPASKWWSGFGSEPRPVGGQINRRKELKTDCPYYTPC